jgi:hypothetical protein
MIVSIAVVTASDCDTKEVPAILSYVVKMYGNRYGYGGRYRNSEF